MCRSKILFQRKWNNNFPFSNEKKNDMTQYTTKQIRGKRGWKSREDYNR